MIRKILFILFLLTLFGSLGFISFDKLRHERAIDRCSESGGRWNYMEQACDRK